MDASKKYGKDGVPIASRFLIMGESAAIPAIPAMTQGNVWVAGMRGDLKKKLKGHLLCPASV